jgi:hypothetical protein
MSCSFAERLTKLLTREAVRFAVEESDPRLLLNEDDRVAMRRNGLDPDNANDAARYILGDRDWRKWQRRQAKGAPSEV